MKKHVSRCEDCGEDNFILTQISSGPEVMLLCNDCYKLKYLKEIHNEISYDEEEKN